MFKKLLTKSDDPAKEFDRVSGILKVIKASGLIILFLLYLVPAWINYFDQGKESISIEQLIKDNKYVSSKFTITGKPAFEYVCKFEDYNEEGRLNNVLYYIPFVPQNWSKEQEVKTILILDSGERGWDNKEFKPALSLLEHTLDSLKQIEGTIRIPVSYSKYEFFKFKSEPLKCMKNKYNLKLSEEVDLKKLVYNEKQSLVGKVFLTIVVFVLMVFIYIKIK